MDCPSQVPKKKLTLQQRLGSQVENAVCDYLLNQQLILIAKNYRCLYGEIDLIMHDKDFYVFVEVRYRTQQDFGNSIETVTRAKQNRIIRTATYFLIQENLLDIVDSRFDVIGVDGAENNASNSFTWIQHAFEK